MYHVPSYEGKDLPTSLQKFITDSEQDRIKSVLFSIVDPAEFWHSVGFTQQDLEGAVFTAEWTSSNYLNWTFEVRTLEDHLIIFYDGYNGLDADGDEWKIQEIIYN